MQILGAVRVDLIQFSSDFWSHLPLFVALFVRCSWALTYRHAHGQPQQHSATAAPTPAPAAVRAHQSTTRSWDIETHPLLCARFLFVGLCFLSHELRILQPLLCRLLYWTVCIPSPELFRIGEQSHRLRIPGNVVRRLFGCCPFSSNSF